MTKWNYEKLLSNIEAIQVKYFDKSSSVFLGRSKNISEDEYNRLAEERQKEIEKVFKDSGWTQSEFEKEQEKQIKLANDLF